MKTISFLLALAALATVDGPARAQPMQVLVPAYFYPSWMPSQSFWDEMQALTAQGVEVTAIMNVDSGHALAANSDYAVAVEAFKKAGGHLLAYVATCYGVDNCYKNTPAHQPPAAVLREVEQYFTWYPGILEGVFLDEMSTSTEPEVIDYYTQISSELRSKHAGQPFTIVGNAGTAAPRQYLGLVDTLVTFEGSEKMYRSWGATPLVDWAADEPASRQAHLIYNTYSESAMHELLSLAASRKAGYVYITDEHHDPSGGNIKSSLYEPKPEDHPDDDDNPWNGLPSYWPKLIAAVSSITRE